MAPYWSGVQTRAMPTVSAASRQLKLLRQRAGLSIRQVAEALGMEHGSSYQHYEDRFKKPLMPLDLVLKLVPIFEPRGVEAAELFALAGVDGSGHRPLASTARPEAGAPTLRIEELDVRAGAGSGLTDGGNRPVAEWQIPREIIRRYTTAPAAELRILTLLASRTAP